MADDKPICPMKMTFEEMIELKMKQNAEKDQMAQTLSPDANTRKQHFLKKGEGLNRWVPKNPNSPEAEQPATPQPNKSGNVRRKVFSAAKDSTATKVGTSQPPLRVPSHVVPPRSPRQAHLPPSKAPVKPIPAPNLPLKRGKQSPVPPSPRAVHPDFTSKSSSLPRSISPASFIAPSTIQSAHEPETLNKPTDMTICSEKEFEQLEEFIDDHPLDTSICSQASVVRKFMSRPSLRSAVIDTASKLTNQRGNDPDAQMVANDSFTSSHCGPKVHNFHDDEAWGPETTRKFELPAVNPQLPSSPSPDLTETPKRQSQPSEPAASISLQSNNNERPISASVPDPLQPLNDALRTKILQLDVEIDKFRTENRRLEERKNQFEKIQSEFISEKRKFDEQMETETAKFEQFKRQEMSKIKRERTALDQLRTQVHTLASEKNSVELVQLRERLRRIEQEANDKEERHAKESSRLKDQVKRLQVENEELKRSIEMLERLRIDRNAAASNAKNVSSPRGAVASALQSLRKPLPLKSDTRQNVIPSNPSSSSSSASANAKNTDVVAIVTSSDSSGSKTGPERQKQQQPPQNAQPTLANSCSDKEDERDANMNNSTSNDEFDKAQVNVLQQDTNNIDEVDHNEQAAARLYESMGPTQAALMQQWLKDVGLCLFEDDEVCVATLEKEFPDGKVEVTRSDGSRRINFSNGTIKVIGAEGSPIFIRFFNKDMKKVMQDGTIVYYYSDTQTIQTTHVDGLEVMEFSNGQVEKKYPNGTQDVVFPDGTVKQTYLDGMEVCTFVDGCVVTTSANGDRVIEFPNGQKEMHTAEYKSRVYPNGIVRVVFKNGLCETRYPNGEVRRKQIRETPANDLGSKNEISAS